MFCVPCLSSVGFFVLRAMEPLSLPLSLSSFFKAALDQHTVCSSYCGPQPQHKAHTMATPNRFYAVFSFPPSVNQRTCSYRRPGASTESSRSTRPRRHRTNASTLKRRRNRRKPCMNSAPYCFERRMPHVWQNQRPSLGPFMIMHSSEVEALQRGG